MAPPLPFPLTGELVIASHNEGKVREIGDLLAPLGVTARAAGALGLPEPDETEDSFAGNALLKARAAAGASGLPALADDSGLAVRALGGAPGIRSARWAGPERDFALAMANGEPGARRQRRTGAPPSSVPWRWRRRTAARPCSRAGSRAASSGRRAATAASATTRSSSRTATTATFGEMEPAAKHAISHRARAFAKLLAAWRAAA